MLTSYLLMTEVIYLVGFKIKLFAEISIVAAYLFEGFSWKEFNFFNILYLLENCM